MRKKQDQKHFKIEKPFEKVFDSIFDMRDKKAKDRSASKENKRDIMRIKKGE